MKITLAYTPEEGVVFIQEIELAEGADIQTALTQSDIANKYPEIDLNNCKTGVYSQPKPHDHVLQNGDRVEIYRPLSAAQRQFAKDRLKNA